MGSAAVDPGSSTPGVLVVDADPATRQLLRDFLAGAGFASEAAPDLAGALARVRGAPPAAVVLHDHVSGAEGLEILRSLRVDHPEVPVVFIAAGTDAHTRAAVTRMAATSFVDKPFGISDLLTTIVRAVHSPVTVRGRVKRTRGGPRPRRAALVGGGHQGPSRGATA